MYKICAKGGQVLSSTLFVGKNVKWVEDEQCPGRNFTFVLVEKNGYTKLEYFNTICAYIDYEREQTTMVDEATGEHEAERSEAAVDLLTLALLYEKQGEYVKAEPLYQRALAILLQQAGPAHPDTIQ